MEAKHTPGPWMNIGNCRIHGTPPYGSMSQTETGAEWEGVPVNAIQEVCVAFPASVYGYSKGGKNYPVRKDVQDRWWERNRANIALICAAPDMLEALHSACSSNPDWELITSAIKKAEGREE